MSGLVQAATRATAVIERRGLGYCLVGGFAVSVRTEPRFTRDLDLAVAVHDDAEAERLTSSLLDAGFHAEAMVEQDAVGRLATVRLVDADGWRVDLLFASSGIEAELVAAATPLDVLPGLVVPVASLGHLVALKLLARDDDTRPQDAGDLRALRDAATDDDVTEASRAVTLIDQRGYGRGRDLPAALDAWIGTAGSHRPEA